MNKLHTIGQKAARTARNAWAATTNHAAKGMTAVGGVMASGMAMAQDGLGTLALAEVQNVKSDVSAILAVLVGVVFLLVAWAYFKKAK